MSSEQHKMIIKEMRDKGFKKASNGAQTGLTGPYAKKLQALWIACWNMGIIRDKRDSALLAFVKRQSGLDHTRFLHHAGDATKVIEALKGMLAREGVDWSNLSSRAHWQRVDGYRISIAQWGKVEGEIDANSFQDYLAYCSFHSSDADWSEAKNSNYIPVMNELGRQIRAKAAE